MVDENLCNAINAALSDWRQGDCVLGDLSFVFRLDLDNPLTENASLAAKEGIDLAEAKVCGFMIATQTCDLVRDCALRPYVEVCPLVEVPPETMHEIQRCRRPRYAHISGVSNKNLVVDLDRSMTVEKAVVAKWRRLPGCETDRDFRSLALALSRKRARFAFPDDFIDVANGLQRFVAGKHSKNSEAGDALRALREIRVSATPAWGADSIELNFWFIRDADEGMLTEEQWARHLESWEQYLVKSGRYGEVFATIVDLEDMTAQDYVESDRLDLDHLSS